ncbi:MAG: thioesterase [Crocinitomicaceae bacterium]|jgi:surfactin synthase thioesterase subunit|nr:thioesterase [Crocinitomicaceae bacterium]
MKIICLPFAGGSSYSYQTMQNLVTGQLETIELPGRGKRIMEPLQSNTDLLVEDIFVQLQTLVESGEKYILFGHSMGALLGYLLLCKCREKGFHLPQAFIASGANAPSYPREIEEEGPTYLLDKSGFINKLRKLGGCPEEVLQHDALMDFYEPILRNDFQVVETYSYNDAEPLPLDVKVLLGEDDKVKPESAELWQKDFQSAEVYWFPGGHFFIFDHLPAITRIINEYC